MFRRERNGRYRQRYESECPPKGGAKRWLVNRCRAYSYRSRNRARAASLAPHRRGRNRPADPGAACERPSRPMRRRRGRTRSCRCRGRRHRHLCLGEVIGPIAAWHPGHGRFGPEYPGQGPSIASMSVVSVLDAPTLRRAIEIYRDVLAIHRSAINRLNVYPVPDGDTGTNMALTVESVADELA